MINDMIKCGLEGFVSYSNDINADINSEWKHVPFICDFLFNEITKIGSISIGFTNSKDEFYNLQNNISFKYSVVSSGLDTKNPDESLLINNVQITDKIFNGSNANKDELVTCIYKFSGNYYWVEG